MKITIKGKLILICGLFLAIPVNLKAQEEAVPSTDAATEDAPAATAEIPPPAEDAPVTAVEAPVSADGSSEVVDDDIMVAETVQQSALPADYSIKLKDLEQRVNQLKERIHQSKARLVQLQEVVIHGTISGARAKIIHHNELGRNYTIERLQYSLDSQPIYNKVAVDGDLTKMDGQVIFDDAIAPGNHLLSVYMELKGDGHKVFTYINNYEFKIKSSHTFSADEGKVTTVSIVPQLKGNMTYSMLDRPSVRYDVERKKALREEFEDAGSLSK